MEQHLPFLFYHKSVDKHFSNKNPNPGVVGSAHVKQKCKTSMLLICKKPLKTRPSCPQYLFQGFSLLLSEFLSWAMTANGSSGHPLH